MKAQVLQKLKKLIIGLIVVSASLLTIGQATAYAAAKSGGQGCTVTNSILAGMMRGANFTMDTKPSCTQSTQAAQSSDTSQPATSTTPVQSAFATPLVTPTPSHASSHDSSTTVVTTGPAPQTGAVYYAALGDSVAAGAGLSPALSGTDPACDASSQAYPTLVASSLGVTYQNFACSGATAGDLVTEQHLSGTSRDIEPQLDMAFASGTPTLITLTAGANDTYWQRFVRKCYAATCGTSADNAAASTLLAAFKLKLEYALEQIRSRSTGTGPNVILTGYFQPLSTACSNLQNEVNTEEIAWLNNQTDALNSIIASAAAKRDRFVRHAPIDFSGHDICSADPWVQGFKDEAPFHPTARGQQEIAEAILAQIH